jgi:hypothetical protein
MLAFHSICAQVEMAIFKIHRHFLVKHSPVIATMFDIDGDKQAHEGTDEHPLHLDDKARAWELLLGAFYRECVVTDFHYHF